MAYKDKDRQREANRLAKRRQRQRQGMIKGMTSQGMTVIDEPPDVIPNPVLDVCKQRIRQGFGHITSELTKTRQISRKGFNG